MKKLTRIISLFICATVAAISLTACSGGEKTYTIGINQYGEHASLDNCRKGFVEGLKEAGLVEGENLEIDYQNASFDDSINTQIAQNFVSKKVDLMCGIATPSAQSCFTAAEDANIPVVFVAVNDPEAAKLTSGNVTGTSDKLPVDAQLELIRKTLPDAKNIGIIYTTSEQNSLSTIADYKEQAPKFGFNIVDVGVSSQSDIPLAVDNLLSKVDCISNLTDNTVVGALASILEKTNEKGIPVFGSEVEQVKIGCVAAAGIDYVELGKKSGAMAAKVLKGEAKASDINYEVIKDYSYYINSSALKTLNITLPDEIKSKAIESTEA